MPERHIVDLQPHGQVVRPVAGDQHRPAAQRREVDVVEPGGVEAVGVAGVDGQQGRRLARPCRTPPASWPGSWPAAAGCCGRPGRPGRTGRRPRLTAASRGTASSGRTPNSAATASAVAALPRLTWPGSCSLTRCQSPRGVDHAVVLDGHCGLRAAQRAAGAPPVAVGPLDRRAALRADPGVVVPALAGAEPGDVRGVDRGPDHHRVVGVGDHVHVGVGGQGGAPQLRHHRHLLGPVELVAGEVEQRDHPRRGLVDHPGQVVLVDLEHRERRGAGLGQRRGVPGRHVGAERVGGDRAEHAERGGGEPGRGGLAVGAGDQRDRAAGGEVRQQVRVDLETDPAADHRAVAASGGPGERGRGPRHGGRDLGPQGHLPVRHGGEVTGNGHYVEWPEARWPARAGSRPRPNG